jgi:hypothetical protein
VCRCIRCLLCQQGRTPLLPLLLLLSRTLQVSQLLTTARTGPGVASKQQQQSNTEQLDQQVFWAPPPPPLSAACSSPLRALALGWQASISKSSTQQAVHTVLLRHVNHHYQPHATKHV